MTRPTQLFSLCLVAIGVAAGCSDAKANENEPSASSTDFEILEVALLDLIDDKKFRTLPDLAGKKTTVVLSDLTVGNTEILVDWRNDYPDWRLSNQLRSDLQRRNLTTPISLAAFVPTSDKILVEDLTGLVFRDEFVFEDKYPNAKGYVEAWLPGYSKDRNEAVVRLEFGPNRSSVETATYWLVKQEGRWNVKRKRQEGYAVAGIANVMKYAPYTLLPVSEIKLAQPMKATEAEAKEIRRLIKALAEIDSPDYGLSSTLTGDLFAPIPSTGHFGGGLITRHDLKTSSALTTLVELGPKSLPFLLESIEDDTPTKLQVKHGASFFGGMSFGHEIRGNPVNKVEFAALKDADTDSRRHIDDPYTVRVGDVCFVAIGQITNRFYSAVRYQPSACIIINSPVQDKKLAAEVRAIWGESVDAQKLLESLLIDFHTRGAHSNSLQTGAALRLAYFFPNESSQLIADRINGLDVTTANYRERKKVNGVRADDLIDAVSWSTDERIKRTISKKGLGKPSR